MPYGTPSCAATQFHGPPRTAASSAAQITSSRVASKSVSIAHADRPDLGAKVDDRRGTMNRAGRRLARRCEAAITVTVGSHSVTTGVGAPGLPGCSGSGDQAGDFLRGVAELRREVPVQL